MDSNLPSNNAYRSTDDRENHIASWYPELKAFLSPRRPMLLPESQILLSHYLDVTGPKLAPAPDTPFVSWLLPVAYSDDLLMNGILALSGGHLLYKLPENRAIQQATSRHYSLALQSLQQVLNDGSTLLEPLVLVRVALLIVILFHYEVSHPTWDTPSYQLVVYLTWLESSRWSLDTWTDPPLPTCAPVVI